MSEKHTAERCDKITFEPTAQKSCRNPVVRDGFCEEHHPTLRAERDVAMKAFCEGFDTKALEGTTLAEVADMLRWLRGAYGALNNSKVTPGSVRALVDALEGIERKTWQEASSDDLRREQQKVIVAIRSIARDALAYHGKQP